MSGKSGTTVQTFEYDRIGKLLRTTDNNGNNVDAIVEYEYNKVNRIVKGKNKVGDKTEKVIDEKSYDKNSNKTGLMYTSGRSISLSYDCIK